MHRGITTGLLIGLVVAWAAGWAGGAPAARPGKNAPAVADSDAPCAPGATSPEIKTSGGEWSYFVYLPKAYTPARKWPVLFVMSPSGGNAGMLKRYIEGAEMNNWILAGSRQSKNNFAQSEQAVRAMVTDVCKKLPVDPKRMYSSGFSGGARMAFWLAQELKTKGFAGVLACGAGGNPELMSPKTVMFGLSGSNCFNRWDMACTLKRMRNDLSRLRFFIGKHAWADAVLIKYAMTWLNACYLKVTPPGSTALDGEKKQLVAGIQAEIQQATATNPEKAYDWALCLAAVATAPTAPEQQPLQTLLKNPKVQLYVAGLKDMDLFVKKHFATSVMDYVNNNGTPAAKRDADRLAAKYAATGLAELFAKMGEPAGKP
ncbi:MAG: hypothetical protein NTV49_13450 [Kiritimatiellaeota bacterium]|nr:hypothetical protein [Kiritimatiellota bacterium]